MHVVSCDFALNQSCFSPLPMTGSERVESYVGNERLWLKMSEEESKRSNNSSMSGTHLELLTVLLQIATIGHDPFTILKS